MSPSCSLADLTPQRIWYWFLCLFPPPSVTLPAHTQPLEDRAGPGRVQGYVTQENTHFQRSMEFVEVGWDVLRASVRPQRFPVACDC